MSKTSYSVDGSTDYNKVAAKTIAGSVNSNVRLAGSPTPLCFERGEGAYLYDIDGNRYFDYALGMGPTILGHAPKAVCDAVAQSLYLGQMFAGQHTAELELAQLLQTHIPSAQLTRVGMSGSEMVQAALRVSRAFTGKRKFIKFEGQYHGWYDNVLISHAPQAADDLPIPRDPHLESAGQTQSVKDEIIVLPWNDVEALETVIATHGDDIAAIITEPAMCNTGVIAPCPGYLERMRELTTANNIILIFDEVITGFRLALGGAQDRFGITPDLSTFAKAMAGGFPVAALVGRTDLMEMFGTGKVNHSGTYNSNVQSVVAAVATLKELEANDGAALKHVDEVGNRLIDGLKKIAADSGENLQVTGYGAAVNTYFGEPDSVCDYQSYKKGDAGKLQALLSTLTGQGVRPTGRGTWFISAAHSNDDIDQTLAIVRDALATA